ncbi:MAG: carcinine hydrolase/isopenicillin-N N-acyltransferase family protein [Bacilli bacterium]|nr:carcinine hydrolase/isopenicillin-N N-acyltransferase family protein [Bacilli bacterium]
MNIKRSLLIVFPVLVTCGALSTSCQKRMYGEIKHLAPYLHQIDYTDYVYDEKEETVYTEGANSMSMGGCVGIRKGNFYGRNFDNARRTMPEFVVSLPKKGDRHASIGIANSYVMREKGVLEGTYTQHDYEILPNHMLDGINDAGVVVNCNMVKEKDTGPLEHTNIEKEPLHVCFIPRLVLDNASSAAEAIELIKNRDIHGSQIVPPFDETMTMQLLIADPKETYYVSFRDENPESTEETHISKMVVEKYTDINNDSEQLMTNFLKKVEGSSQKEDYPENSVGVERYEILKKGYDSVKDANDLRELMKTVRFSNFYQNYHAFADEDHPDFSGYLNWWLSEEGTQTQIKYFKEWIIEDKQDPKELEGDGDKALILNGICDQLHDYETEFLPMYWSNIIADYRGEDMTGWITIHNSIYDIEKRSLLLTVQENYNDTYKFTLGV